MRLHCWILFLGILCLAGCKVKRPDSVLSDSKMEAILYDYHIAKVMGEDIPQNESYKRVLYIESVYKKHGISKAQFDSSMVWFARNPESLKEIYEKVNLRLKEEQEKLDGLIALRDNRPKTSKPGDSINVWAWRGLYELFGSALNNKVAFVLPSDSNFKDRDTLRWSVRYHWNDEMTMDSAHAPVMAMQILYANDTLSTLHKITQRGRRSIELWADTLGKLKEVRGFVYYPASPRLPHILLDSITLMRYHAANDTESKSNEEDKNHSPQSSSSTLIPKREKR